MPRLLSAPRLRRAAALAALLVLTYSSAGASALLPAYFGPGAAERLDPLIIFRQAPPPLDNHDNVRNYAYGPITDSMALNVAAQNSSSWTRGHDWPMIWANRARVPPGHVINAANSIFPVILDPSGVPYMAEFSSVAKANAVTRAQVLYTIGVPQAQWMAPLLAVGMTAADAIPWATLNAAPKTYFTQASQDGQSTVMLDKMAIPAVVAASPYGVVIDWEVQDDRSSAQTIPFLANLSADIHSKNLKAYLYTNPWEDPSNRRDGFSFGRIDQVKSNFDYISLYVWGAPHACDFSLSYPEAIKFLRGVSGVINFSQIILTVDLSLCSPSTADAIYNQQKIDHFSGYNLYPDGAVQGGPTLTGSNLVINGLLTGQ